MEISKEIPDKGLTFPFLRSIVLSMTTTPTTHADHHAPIGYQSDRVKGQGRRGLQSVTRGWRTSCSCGEVITTTGSSHTAHKARVAAHIEGAK